VLTVVDMSLNGLLPLPEKPDVAAAATAAESQTSLSSSRTAKKCESGA